MWGDAGGASRIFTDEDADWAEQGGWVSESESQDSEDLDLDAVLAAVGLGRRRAVLVQIGVCSLGGVGGATPDQLLDAGLTPAEVLRLYSALLLGAADRAEPAGGGGQSAWGSRSHSAGGSSPPASPHSRTNTRRPVQPLGFAAARSHSQPLSRSSSVAGTGGRLSQPVSSRSQEGSGFAVRPSAGGRELLVDSVDSAVGAGGLLRGAVADWAAHTGHTIKSVPRSAGRWGRPSSTPHCRPMPFIGLFTSVQAHRTHTDPSAAAAR